MMTIPSPAILTACMALVILVVSPLSVVGPYTMEDGYLNDTFCGNWINDDPDRDINRIVCAPNGVFEAYSVTNNGSGNVSVLIFKGVWEPDGNFESDGEHFDKVIVQGKFTGDSSDVKFDMFMTYTDAEHMKVEWTTLPGSNIFMNSFHLDNKMFSDEYQPPDSFNMDTHCIIIPATMSIAGLSIATALVSRRF